MNGREELNVFVLLASGPLNSKVARHKANGEWRLTVRLEFTAKYGRFA